MLNTREDIIHWLDKYNINNYIINKNLSVNVEGMVDLFNKNITEIPFFFDYVSGDFDIGENQLTSLLGCPNKVGKSFYVWGNKLKSLEFSPLEIYGDYEASDNPLLDISKINYVEKDIILRNIPLTNLAKFEGSFMGEIYICGYTEGKHIFINGFEDFYQESLLKINYSTLQEKLFYNQLDKNIPQKYNHIKKKNHL